MDLWKWERPLFQLSHHHCPGLCCFSKYYYDTSSNIARTKQIGTYICAHSHLCIVQQGLKLFLQSKHIYNSLSSTISVQKSGRLKFPPDRDCGYVAVVVDAVAAVVVSSVKVFLDN